MDFSKLVQEVQSGVVLISFYRNGQKVSSGSAFLCGCRVVSNNHVFHPPDGDFTADTDVLLKTQNSEFKFQYSRLAEYVERGSTEGYGDYIVLDLKDPKFYQGKYSFELGTHDDIEIGQQVVIMGYPFEHEHLTTHIGYVSAKYADANVNVIQLDASVNNGNSGGPLINPGTRRVVGVVTRKATGLARQFDELMRSFDDNAKTLGGVSGISFGGITIGQAFAVSQYQMKEIAKNIKRSANVGIGYAYSCDRLMDEIS